MGESNTRRITKLGQKVADELVIEDPPADKLFEREELLARVGLKKDPGTRTEMVFFQGLNERLKDKAGRMYVSLTGTGQVRICSKHETVGLSETISTRSADLALEKHIHTVTLVTKHLDAQGRAEAADSIARVSNLAAQIRHSQAKAAQAFQVTK